MAKKIEFSVQIFYSDRYPTKFRTVTNLASAWAWCEQNNSKNITAMDIYRKKTKEFLCRVNSLNAAVNYYHSLPSKFE